MAYDTWGGSWGVSWLLSWTRGEPTPPTPGNGWLGGPTDYAVRKKHLEELDKIDEKIRQNRLKEAAKLLSKTSDEIPVEIPEIRKIDKSFIKEFKKHQLNVEAIKAEIQLLRQYLLSQQIFNERMALELDDEAAFLLCI